MTLPTGRAGGFTLLETLITLAIIALFSAVFLLRFDDGRPEELLSEAASELKSVALLAKKRAHSFRQDHVIYFQGAKVFLIEGKGVAGEEGGLPVDADRELYYTIPPDLLLEIRTFGESRWMPLQEYTWSFRKSGLNEPLGIRLSIENSHTVLYFHSLTGWAEEETWIE